MRVDALREPPGDPPRDPLGEPPGELPGDPRGEPPGETPAVGWRRTPAIIIRFLSSHVQTGVLMIARAGERGRWPERASERMRSREGKECVRRRKDGRANGKGTERAGGTERADGAGGCEWGVRSG